MEYTFTKPRKGRILVVGKSNDSTVYRETYTPDKQAEQQRFVRETGLSVGILFSAVETFEADPKHDPVVVNKQPDKPVSFSCTRRLRTSSAGTAFTNADPLTAFTRALEGSNDTHLIEWDDTERLAVLDVDYHDRDNRPSLEYLSNAMVRVMPVPSLWWVTGGRGIHAVYTADSGFTAGELAAVAGLSYLGIDPTATFEVLSRTSGCTSYKTTVQLSDVSTLSRWLRTVVSEDQINDYLERAGYVAGESYEHSHCPVCPSEQSHGKPVWIGEGGLFCHKCEALGVRMGSKRAGFFPYASLIHGGTPGHIRLMAQNFTHYEHAQLVLEDTAGVRGNIATLAYRALLRVLHGGDKRVERVFAAGNNIIRLDNRWGTRDALSAYDKNIQPILAALPACQGEDGKLIPERVSRFTQNIDLGEYGYPAVTPIRGLRIYSHRLAFSDTDRISVVVPSGVLRSPSMERYRPRYVPVDGRLPDPWGVVEESLPGVDRSFVTLLIAAKGIAEGQVGLAPNILVCGPTASGKSTMVTLAAAICGDHNTEVLWQKNAERFRQGVADGADKGTFVTINEVFKDAARTNSTAVQALDVFLNLTPDSVSHRLYVGPVPLGRVPVCVATDIEVPQVLRNDVQLARRFVYVRLRDSHPEWVDTLASSGLFRVQGFRCLSERYAAAADAIVSDTIDKFFDRPRTLSEVASALGYTLLTDSPDFDDPREELRTLYQLVCTAPEAASRRFNGLGWKVVTAGEETPLCEAWERVSDGENGDKWFSSRRCSECDWKRLLRSNNEIRLETRRHRQQLALRFTEKMS